MPVGNWARKSTVRTEVFFRIRVREIMGEAKFCYTLRDKTNDTGYTRKLHHVPIGPVEKVEQIREQNAETASFFRLFAVHAATCASFVLCSHIIQSALSACVGRARKKSLKQSNVERVESERIIFAYALVSSGMIWRLLLQAERRSS